MTAPLSAIRCPVCCGVPVVGCDACRDGLALCETCGEIATEVDTVTDGSGFRCAACWPGWYVLARHAADGDATCVGSGQRRSRGGLVICSECGAYPVRTEARQ